MHIQKNIEWMKKLPISLLKKKTTNEAFFLYMYVW